MLTHLYIDFAASHAGLNHFSKSMSLMSCLQEKVTETKVEEEEESPVPSPLPKVEMLPPETADKRFAMFSIPVCNLVCALGYG